MGADYRNTFLCSLTVIADTAKAGQNFKLSFAIAQRTRPGIQLATVVVWIGVGRHVQLELDSAAGFESGIIGSNRDRAAVAGESIHQQGQCTYGGCCGLGSCLYLGSRDRFFVVLFACLGFGMVCPQQSECAYRVGVVRGPYLRTIKLHVLDLAGLNAGRVG